MPDRSRPPVPPPAPATATPRPHGPDAPGPHSGEEDPGAALDDPELRDALRGEREQSEREKGGGAPAPERRDKS